MSDAALNEAVARAMGLEVLDWSDCDGGRGWHDLVDGQLMRAHPNAGGCLLDHEGREWDCLADDYSGVPAMEAWCSERELYLVRRQDADGRHSASVGKVGIGYWTGEDPKHPRALARAIVAAVEAGR